MIINHNISALNTYRQLSSNSSATSNSLEKLSSGLRINRAGDDAAGLAISEKMRGQIRGLEQATRNAQDGISMIQTAEGALNETHSILQRMRELATQSANGTNTDEDRAALQDEMNQLTSEINRIGNTTEFNTQKLLQGDGEVNLTETSLVTDGTLTNGATTHAAATQTATLGALAAGDGGGSFSLTINGEELTVNLVEDASLTDAASVDTASATSNSINLNYDGAVTADNLAIALKSAFDEVIKKNDVLEGNVTLSTATTDLTLTLQNDLDGAAGNMTALTETGVATDITDAAASVGTTTQVQASSTVDFASITTAAGAEALVGTGMTINGQQIEFYNANDGTYTGSAQGIDISDAIEATANNGDALVKAISEQADIDDVTLSINTTTASTLDIKATVGGEAGNSIEVKDGGVQENFKTSFQIGANTGQSMSLEISDMRSAALGLTGEAGEAGFTTTNTVTNGTDDVENEAALNVSTKEDASKAIEVLDNAISAVSSERSKLGAVQNRLDHTINNLGTSAENLTAAESRIRDVDMAKEMMEFTKNNILTQAAQSMLAQANQQPQGVLQLLR